MADPVVLQKDVVEEIQRLRTTAEAANLEAGAEAATLFRKTASQQQQH
jgi:hypothetical protein